MNGKSSCLLTPWNGSKIYSGHKTHSRGSKNISTHLGKILGTSRRSLKISWQITFFSRFPLYVILVVLSDPQMYFDRIFYPCKIFYKFRLSFSTCQIFFWYSITLLRNASRHIENKIVHISSWWKNFCYSTIEKCYFLFIFWTPNSHPPTADILVRSMNIL